MYVTRRTREMVWVGGGSRRAAWALFGALAISWWCAPAAVAGLASPMAFGAAVRANADGFAALSCASARLCVGVDSSGRIVSSTHPSGGAGDWRTQTISGPAGPVPLTQVSCPSTSLCVAIGGIDDVVSSTDPYAPTPTWRVTEVTESSPPRDSTAGLGGIACPTTSLCVVTDQDGDVITSVDPGSSQATWTVSHVDVGTTYECIHYDQTGCQPGLGPVSCTSASRCVAMDFEGNLLSSRDPAGGASAWELIGGEYDTPDTFWGYLTCAPALCLTAQYYDPGVYAQSLSEGRPALPVFTVRNLVSALACPSATLCLAGNSTDKGAARVYLTTAPRTGAWRTVYSAAPALTGGSTISAISCPSTRLCFVADDAGRVAVGTPNPSRAQIRAALGSLIRSTGRQATIGWILHQSGEHAAFTAPVTGTLKITWHRSAGDRASRGAGPVLASATTRLTKGQRATVLVKLTAAGRRLLSRTAGRLALVIRARLASASEPPMSVTTRITLRPR
jgi:hypothetical protein